MRIRLSIILAAGALLGITACGNSSREAKDANEAKGAVTGVPADSYVPAAADSVRLAIISGDSVSFANLVDYPLERPYPLRDIENEAEMRRYFPVMADDSLRKVVSGLQRKDWVSYGWRGWSFLDGKYLWLDDDRIVSVPYLSRAEAKLRQELIAQEKGSLNPSLQGNWEPVATMREDGGNRVFRIDADGKDDTKVRMVEYASPAAMRGPGAKVFTGRRHLEGSMANMVYELKAADGTALLYSPDITDDTPLSIYETLPGGKQQQIPVTPARWLDLLPTAR